LAPVATGKKPQLKFAYPTLAETLGKGGAPVDLLPEKSSMSLLAISAKSFYVSSLVTPEKSFQDLFSLCVYLALALLVLRYFANHPHHTAAMDDLALVTNLFYRCPNFHHCS
jgi:hypothetical protein